VAASDAHFAWMLGEAAEAPDGLRLPPGGVEDPAVLGWLRRGLPGVACRSWLMTAGGEVVGLCSHKGPPDAQGEAELGYGVTAERRRRGYATQAVALMVAAARADPGISALTAQTALANLPSQRALEANGFAKVGTAHDPEDGDLLVWRLDTSGA
jgi:RimJ/RimL family protein N-acetyltransferase